MNVSVAGLVLWLHVVGTAVGVKRAVHAPGESYVPPEWVSAWSGIGFAVFGTLSLIFFVWVLAQLWPAAFRYFWVSAERARRA
ncbi:hypothetical protein [Candidatus Palauibacter sp.]|uniref:hypothetical protein n=1 Tax=Candidatus Palauibacter sp. TaxID=3101350 RepID=UPI003B02088E